MTPTLPYIVVSIGLMLVGSIITWFFTQAKANKDAKSKQDDRITELERQLGIVGAQVAPFNTAFQSMLIKQLTHAHTPYQDALMQKLGEAGVPPTITPQEEVELLAVLKQIANDPSVPDDERDAATILPIQMRRVKRDAEKIAQLGASPHLVDIQVVGMIDSGEEG